MKKKNYTMKELPASERPYEKCIRRGAGSLSDAELLAVIIKTGTKERTCLSLAVDILRAHPSFKGLTGLYHLTIRDLTRIDGIGQVKAVQLLCVAELAKRLSRNSGEKKVRMVRPDDVAAYFMEEMRSLETEHFYVALMDAGCHLLHYQALFVGTVNTSVASPREILRLALQHDAAQYVVLHNHPSGNPEPSPEDIRLTRKLSDASSLVGIPLMDHIIIGDNKFISLRESGCL